jgi:hypothetical protein
VTLLASARASPEQDTPGLLIQEARRRQRHRWLAVLLAVVVGATSYAVVQATSTGTPPVLSLSLFSRPLHLPPLGPNASCPTSTGSFLHTPLTSGTALGNGPVRILIGNAGDLAHGRVDVGTSNTSHWGALETIWIAVPGYEGPFVVRARRIGAPGAIEVQPGPTGLTPGSGPLVVPAGPTANSANGYRAVPGSIWVKSPGCYGVQIDGGSFSEVTVVDAVPN